MSRRLFPKPVVKVISEVTEVSDTTQFKETTDIDDLMHHGLVNISRMMNTISVQVKNGNTERETVQNLKDLLLMLGDLKKREAELLDTLSDDELEGLVRESDTNKDLKKGV